MTRVSSPVLVLLLFAVVVAVVEANSWTCHLMPVSVKEVKDSIKSMKSIFQVLSPFDKSHGNLNLSMTVTGADQRPYNVFAFDPDTGDVQVTGIFDWTTINYFRLTFFATYMNGSLADEPFHICVRVGDLNENSPEFGTIKPGYVYELRPAGTFVMKVTAHDADEPDSLSSKIAYSIVEQDPPEDMFNITKDGDIYVSRPSLDRERHDRYILTVKGQDRYGAPDGKTGTGTVTIYVLDVNDNLPTLEEEYEVSIEENTLGVEVMRVQAEDLDLKNTENWEVVFRITKGNEAGYFSITTDPETNEGILVLNKVVNSQDVSDFELELGVRNKVQPYIWTDPRILKEIRERERERKRVRESGGSVCVGESSYEIDTSTFKVKISVKKQGSKQPRFDPKVKVISISEGQNFNMREVISRYPALDKYTGKLAENVKYAKRSDPYNLLTIDPETAEIRLNKMPDRESPFLVNGTYSAQVLCIWEDKPSKTATGTIVIHLEVEDLNDNCPTLTSNIQTMCTTADAVTVTAKDEDTFSNAAPFIFSIVPDGTRGKWNVEYLNETSAILRAQEDMWPGSYEVTLEVRDQQGDSCPDLQRVKVEVCTCEDGKVCRERSSESFPERVKVTPSFIELILLGLLLLLFMLLLIYSCRMFGSLRGGFTKLPSEIKSHVLA